MGTQVSVESIKLSQVQNLPVSVIIRCVNPNQFPTPARKFTTATIQVNNPNELKFYFNPSDSSKVYSEPFNAKLTFYMVPGSTSAADMRETNINLAIAATVTGKDDNGTPILSNMRLVNVGMSDGFNCNGVIWCYTNNNCNAMVGLDGYIPNPTGTNVTSFKLQPNSNPEVGTNSSILLGYTTYTTTQFNDFKLPTVPTNSATLPRVIISVSKQ